MSTTAILNTLCLVLFLLAGSADGFLYAQNIMSSTECYLVIDEEEHLVEHDTMCMVEAADGTGFAYARTGRTGPPELRIFPDGFFSDAYVQTYVHGANFVQQSRAIGSVAIEWVLTPQGSGMAEADIYAFAEYSTSDGLGDAEVIIQQEGYIDVHVRGLNGGLGCDGICNYPVEGTFHFSLEKPIYVSLRASARGGWLYDDYFGSTTTAQFFVSFWASDSGGNPVAFIASQEPRTAGVAQAAYIKASNSGRQDRFGSPIAMDGDTFVVGARAESSNGAGVDSVAQDNDSSRDSGAVYVFSRNGGSWTQEAYIKASNPDPSDGFGAAVAISGDILVVGAPAESSSGAGVNPDAQLDNTLQRSGAVYVFERVDGMWGHTAYLKASNPDTDDSFGTAVAVSGDTIVVGAPGEDSDGIGVNSSREGDNL